MANYLATDTDLTAVANAIRTKGGTSAQLAFPAGFVSAIAAISGGGGTVYTGTVELVDTSTTSLTIPVDISSATAYVVSAYIDRTGVVSGGVTTYDDEPTANASQNTIWYVAAYPYQDAHRFKYDSTHYCNAQRPANIIIQWARAGNNGGNVTNNTSIVSGTNIVIPTGNATRYFCYAGCYNRFAYQVAVM